MNPSDAEIVSACCDLFAGESVMVDDVMTVELQKRGLITKYSDHSYVLSAAGQILASRVSLREVALWQKRTTRRSVR